MKGRDVIKIDWLQIYWWLLLGGLGITILYLLVGDLLEGIFGGIDGVFNPTLVFSALTIIGGAGILFSKYTQFSEMTVLGISIMIGLIAYIIVYYVLVLPMSRAEVSTTYSIKELEGCLAEVITSIPNKGYGEVILSTISGTVNFSAKSIDDREIPLGVRVVVVKAEQDHLLVTRFEEKDELN